MMTPSEYRDWLVYRIKTITHWEENDIHNYVHEEAVDMVEYAGEIALLFGRHDLYTKTRVRRRMIAFPVAKKMLGECLALANELIEKTTPRPSTAVAVMEPVAPPPKQVAAEPAPVNERTTEENEALAIALLVKHPDWPKTRIAQEVGVDRRMLYN
jgi:hypothetical protein